MNPTCCHKLESYGKPYSVGLARGSREQALQGPCTEGSFVVRVINRQLQIQPYGGRMQVWEGYVPGVKAEEASTSDEHANGHASSDGPQESVAVTVTDVVSGSQFYIQVGPLQNTTCLKI